MRGIRMVPTQRRLGADWYYSHEYWRDCASQCWRGTVSNRFNLVFAHPDGVPGAGVSYWVELPGVPERSRARVVIGVERERNLEMLRFHLPHGGGGTAWISTLGIWNKHPIGMKPSVEGLTPRTSVHTVNAGAEERSSPLPRDPQRGRCAPIPKAAFLQTAKWSFYRNWVFPRYCGGGRLVTLDMRGWAMQPGMLDVPRLHQGRRCDVVEVLGGDLGRPVPAGGDVAGVQLSRTF